MADKYSAQGKPVNKHFWTFRAAAEENAAPELILYGDIASETWWGDEVTPRQFSDELNALGNVHEIVLRINSGGGVFAANAIYTRMIHRNSDWIEEKRYNSDKAQKNIGVIWRRKARA